MPELNDLMKSSTDPQLQTSAGTAPTGQSSDVSVTGTAPTVNASAVHTFTTINCETNVSDIIAFNQNNNQLLNSLIAENSYKTEDSNSLTDRQPTELTFSDLTPPVPNISTLESNRMIIVDTSLPTVDGVSGGIPEPKLVLIQQMSSIGSESTAPSIEIPNNEQLVPAMAPNDGQSLIETVNDGQYSNIFQPVINGPSGSAPQTPADSPISAIEQSVQGSTGSETQQMSVMSPYGSNTTTFANSTTDVFNVPLTQMMPVLSNTSSSVSSDGPLPVLGIEASLQEQLLDAIPPPSTNYPPGPVLTDEKGVPTALPGEFPLSLLPVEEEKTGGIESASVPLDKIEATINMNAKPVPTLTDAISLSQSGVHLIKSLPAHQSSSIVTTNQMEISAQQQYNNLNYSTQLEIQCPSTAGQPIYSTASIQEPQTSASVQLLVQTTAQSESTQEQQSSPTHRQPIPQTLPLQTLQPLQIQTQSQTALGSDPSQQSVINTQSLINVPEVQLPPAPPPPSATSITMFETTHNEMMSDMVTQSHGLPPPPPLQPVQAMNQSVLTPLPEMNTLTNLVPVVEPTDHSLHQTCRQPMNVVIKREPQSYSEIMAEINNNNNTDSTVGLSKVNDNNNNPILNNLCRDIKVPVSSMTSTPIVATTLVNSHVRGYPLCVISTTPTTYMSKNNTTIVAPKHELTLPPKKAKFMSSGYQTISSLPSKVITPSHVVPSSGMLYDLPQHTSAEHRVQSGLTQPSKLPHNMSPPFTTVSPILFSGLMPSVSVSIDGPLPLVKGVRDDKMRQLITTTSIANHPDYPAISGLLSFINPYHKPLSTLSGTVGHHPGSDTPLSLSIKSSATQPAITANPLTHIHTSAHSSSHVPSLTRPSVHHNQSIMSATIVPTAPTAVPVSVVTSLVDHNRALTQRIKTVGKTKINVEHNSTGSTGVKLQLAPLLSGDPAKPFQCALCGKHLASKNVYQLHLRSHSGEKPFSCNLCGHSFSQKTSLTRHMRSHTGERPFPCQVCGKRFADKERIKIHMRTHTGEKPFACDICGKQFSQKSTVKRHMSVHTGEKPFKCETCGKGFANRGNLTAHTKTHSNS